MSELVHVTPMPIAEVEGEMVRVMIAKIPSITKPMDYGFPRNTHIKFEVEARVQSVLHDEIKSGEHKGQLMRVHNFAIEEVRMIGAYTAAQMDQGVGGSASAAAQQEEEEDGRGTEPGEGDGAGGEGWDPEF